MIEIVNGCKIHYDIKINEQSRETPVVFLHGWGCDAGIYRSLIDAVESHATLAMLDFPAHGESDEPSEPWGVADFALQVEQWLKQQQIRKADIVAHSFGARVALWLAANKPEMVGKLIITGGAGIRKPATQQNSKRTARYKRLSAAVRLIMKVPLLHKPMSKVQTALIQRYGSKDYAALSEGMRATFVKIISEDLTPLLKRINSPVLLIWGENDSETPLWMGQTMEREIKDSGLVVFAGRGHFAFLEESARFLTILKQFFWGGDEG